MIWALVGLMREQTEGTARRAAMNALDRQIRPTMDAHHFVLTIFRR
jgi:hypothetical protein